MTVDRRGGVAGERRDGPAAPDRRHRHEAGEARHPGDPGAARDLAAARHERRRAAVPGPRRHGEGEARPGPVPERGTGRRPAAGRHEPSETSRTAQTARGAGSGCTGPQGAGRSRPGGTRARDPARGRRAGPEAPGRRRPAGPAEARGDQGPQLPAPKPEETKLPDLPAVKPQETKTPDLPDKSLDLKLPGLPGPKPMEPAVAVPDLPAPIPDVPSVKAPAATTPQRRSTSLKPAEAAKPLSTSHPVLNTRTCVINYESEGPVRVAARIDFWATKDGGRTWEPLRDEAGGIAPARLTLPGEGVFGIRIRPGAGSKPPEPGEDPDCVVEVDTTETGREPVAADDRDRGRRGIDAHHLDGRGQEFAEQLGQPVLRDPVRGPVAGDRPRVQE